MNATKTHRHKADDNQTKTYGYCGHSVRPDYPNQFAHGGVTYHETCKCGAKRMTNSTGFGRLETGRWTK